MVEIRELPEEENSSGMQEEGQLPEQRESAGLERPKGKNNDISQKTEAEKITEETSASSYPLGNEGEEDRSDVDRILNRESEGDESDFSSKKLGNKVSETQRVSE